MLRVFFLFVQKMLNFKSAAKQNKKYPLFCGFQSLMSIIFCLNAQSFGEFGSTVAIFVISLAHGHY